jgi:hypothetical protein
MSRHIGAGYGSEFHLMRYMARYRNHLDRCIESEIGGTVLEWLDFRPLARDKYDPRDPCRVKLPDGEHLGLEFLQNSRPDALKAWHAFWPTTGNPPNWDAVGRIDAAGQSHWLLVEAKAHAGELNSACTAQPRSMAIIRRALDETRRGLLLHPDNDLTQRYYQYANRLAVLHFCRHVVDPPVPCKLLLIYFTGDLNPHATLCPRSATEWQPALDAQHEWIGLDEDRARELGVHSVSLDVVPPAAV